MGVRFGVQPVALVESSLMEFATSASVPSGLIAIFDGGPITEFGTSFSVTICGGNLREIQNRNRIGLMHQ